MTADKIVIAVGGRPTLNEVPGLKEYAITSDDLFSMKTAPGKTLVVGASYVALECAGFLNSLGYDTSVMVRSILLRGFDQDMANKIGKYMEEHGVKFIRGTVPEKVEKNAEGRLVVTYFHDGAEKQEVYDTVLVAIGRTACTSNINIESTGLVPEANGKLKVNEEEQTSVPHIYAIGDVIYGKLELTPVAIKAGLLLARRLFSDSTELMDYVNVPTTVFTPLEYGACGYTEDEAKAKFGADNVSTWHTGFKPLEWAYNKVRKGGDCYVKYLVNNQDQERVVGFHILSPNAGDITQGIAIAIKCGATKKMIDSTIGIHPTVGEEVIGLKDTKENNPEANKTGC